LKLYHDLVNFLLEYYTLFLFNLLSASSASFESDVKSKKNHYNYVNPFSLLFQARENFVKRQMERNKHLENNQKKLGFIKEKAIIAKYKNPSHNSASLFTNLLN
jgi:CRISPR/Cas system CMR-associated protein Cmr5 small subunit